jgi:pimeloyl-ACP methyl ester carboxylesterase
MRRASSSSDVSIALHDLGGAGPPILLAHPNGFCGLTWGPVASRLPQLHSWALDFRAHGHSTRPADGNFDWAGTADDVLAAVDELGLDRPFAVGHSMGGAALLLAEQRRPGTFRGLWMFEPIVFAPPADVPLDELESPLAASAERRRSQFDDRAKARANFTSKPPMNAFTADAVEAYLDGGFRELPDGQLELRCRPGDEAAFYRMGTRHGAFERLGDVTCPVTVARGRLDPGPAMFGPAVVEALQHGELVEMEWTGHFAPMEDPDAVATAIAASMKRPAG